ncbi:MAG: hypothetical protein A2X67_11400 [Ignavibacteria bacterium GWA2_55_11]|nr:MAG: hypothetical protein A2X67_11400 [Ignavibacteria bacterium GWA2_55_11]OGU45687.1 MAG: hypothetical protein A2X68_04830 [Ignavibacteria bacterium GWC2_56_12]OGU67415.1 MAG: hypothetical protein A3C56_02930 [Ignavibacteria bacterium RIFCSPHIGHO2_02_FULL_56_12]OGU70721.1 MAG: hypothetical protein A3G43_12770 [Ignavibacteria bacterium RIFCSPLOWO2_12_FULL_56_21]OGU72299.1 MAG: hypothetical protein A3H45_08170 [Ignavibacteria bacterium RIFCSPLOWO2_02_FULL_55_14]
MLDYIASAIIFGVLALSVARIQSNINATLYQNTFTVITQQNAVELARQIEFDILKIGHHVRGQRIFYAAERRIQYRADIRNDMDTVNVQYLAGTITQGAITSNPRDFPLFRQEVTTNVRQNWGLIEFRITYFDSNNVQIGTPTNVADTLVKIRGINVKFTVQSPEPVIGQAGDSSWAGVTWEKLMYPRNLGQLNLVE